MLSNRAKGTQIQKRENGNSQGLGNVFSSGTNSPLKGYKEVKKKKRKLTREIRRSFFPQNPGAHACYTSALLLNYAPSTFFGEVGERVSLGSTDYEPQTCNSPVSVSRIAGITDVCHYIQFNFFLFLSFSFF